MLKHWLLVVDVACYRCGLEAKTSLHINRDCLYALVVWEHLRVQWVMHLDGNDFFHWLGRLYLSYPQKQDLNTITIWALWGLINKMINERVLQTVKSISTFTVGYVCELELL